RKAKWGGRGARGGGGGGGGARARQIVEQHLPAAQVPPFAEAALLIEQKEPPRAAGEIEMVERDAGELGGRDGEQREVDALDPEAEAEPTDHGARGHRDRNGAEPAEPGAEAEEDPQKRRRIGAEPDIECVTERELPGKAHHQVPGLTHIGEIEDQGEDREQVAVGDERRRDQRRQRERQHGLRAPVDAAPQCDHARRPRTPRGRSTSTAMSSANENMLFIDGSIMKPASASDTPISTPPTRAPVIQPRPPTMTMMKDSSV